MELFGTGGGQAVADSLSQRDRHDRCRCWAGADRHRGSARAATRGGRSCCPTRIRSGGGGSGRGRRRPGRAPARAGRAFARPHPGTPLGRPGLVAARTLRAPRPFSPAVRHLAGQRRRAPYPHNGPGSASSTHDVDLRGELDAVRSRRCRTARPRPRRAASCGGAGRLVASSVNGSSSVLEQCLRTKVRGLSSRRSTSANSGPSSSRNWVRAPWAMSRSCCAASGPRPWRVRAAGPGRRRSADHGQHEDLHRPDS